MAKPTQADWKVLNVLHRVRKTSHPVGYIGTAVKLSSLEFVEMGVWRFVDMGVWRFVDMGYVEG